MSRRQLRKLQQEKEIREVEVHEEHGVDGRSEKPRQSLFATLATLEEETGGEDYEEQSQQSAPDATEERAKRKKRKSKKKRKKISAENDDGDPYERRQDKGKGKTKSQNEGHGLDEVDRALKELNLKISPLPSQAVPSGASVKTAKQLSEDKMCDLLKINPYNLKFGNEMKALFGRDTLATAESEERLSRAASRHQGHPGTLEDYLNARPNQGLKNISINKNYLIQGKKTWPLSTTQGLSMEKEGDAYTFSHKDQYVLLEIQFLARSSTFNPDILIEFLQENPYHISSLIIVSKIAKHQGDHSLAADLCERALFTFGRIMLSGFKQNLEKGLARLDFAKHENRQFWLSGHQYLRSLMCRGTHKTALEWAKVLLMLDPSDPYAIGQLVHVIAIKAKKFQWFLDLCETGILDVHWGYPAHTAGLARLRLGDEKGAIETIRAGMKEMPWLYSAMFSEFGMDVPKTIWGSIIPDGPDELYSRLYIKQTKELWNYPKATDALFEAAHGFDKPRLAQKAREVTLGVARMVYMDEDQAMIALVPRYIINSKMINEHDPLPPPNHKVNRVDASGVEPLGGALNNIINIMRSHLPDFTEFRLAREQLSNCKEFLNSPLEHEQVPDLDEIFRAW